MDVRAFFGRCKTIHDAVGGRCTMCPLEQWCRDGIFSMSRREMEDLVGGIEAAATIPDEPESARQKPRRAPTGHGGAVKPKTSRRKPTGTAGWKSIRAEEAAYEAWKDVDLDAEKERQRKRKAGKNNAISRKR